MKTAKFQYRECLEMPGECLRFQGKGGHIEIQDGIAMAHITHKKYKLATPDYSDHGREQEIVVSDAGLKGMLEHLKVPVSAAAQRKILARLIENGTLSVYGNYW